MLAQRRDDVPLGAPKDIHEGLRRIGLDLKVESVPGGVQAHLDAVGARELERFLDGHSGIIRLDGFAALF